MFHLCCSHICHVFDKFWLTSKYLTCKMANQMYDVALWYFLIFYQFPDNTYLQISPQVLYMQNLTYLLWKHMSTNIPLWYHRKLQGLPMVTKNVSTLLLEGQEQPNYNVMRFIPRWWFVFIKKSHTGEIQPYRLLYVYPIRIHYFGLSRRQTILIINPVVLNWNKRQLHRVGKR